MYLNGGAQCHANGQVHFVLDGHEDGRDVLARISSDWQHDQAQEALVQARLFAHILQCAGEDPVNLIYITVVDRIPDLSPIITPEYDITVRHCKLIWTSWRCKTMQGARYQ